MRNASATLRPLVCRLFVLSLLSAAFLGGAAAQTYVLSGNTPGFINKAADLGAMDPSTVISVTVWLKMQNEDKLDELVRHQYQKGSSSYHNWITQDQFNASFGPTSQEVNSVQNFLTSHNLSVLTVAENNMYIKVLGTLGDIEKAFHVQIDNYNFNGVTYRSNKGDPSVNDSSGAHIAAITGMDDLGFEPQNVQPTDGDGTPVSFVPLTQITPSGLFFEGQCFRAVETDIFKSTGTKATYTGNRYGADITNTTLGHLPPCGYQPSELQTAYNLNKLYGAGFDGSGETIVITDAYGSDTIAAVHIPDLVRLKPWLRARKLGIQIMIP